MQKKSITDINLKGKRVLVRVDFNVPLDDKRNITDDIRIKASLPTIEYIIKNSGKAILMSHLGRPEGKIVDTMRLTPIAKRLEQLLKKPVKKLNDCIGPEVEKAVNDAKDGDVILLENLRFYKEEEKNNPEFAKKLASLGDVFVNDAFGTCHRAHASTEGVTHYLESVSGFLVQKEIEYFEKILSFPERPFVAILGGAKVSDKIPVIENMLNKVNVVLIGGAMAYTFLKQTNAQIGSSRYEKDMAGTADNILRKAKEKNVEILLPVDHIVCDDINNPKTINITAGINIPDGFLGVDIGPKTIKLFASKIKTAKTIVWNGPMGIFEKDKFANGTKEVALAIAASGATSVIGGGDSAAAVSKFNLDDKMSHISTGGGASLEYLEGKVLPGVAALTDK
ncbi:MAG: phosphoglycerate kinase [Candidatus Omnitrophica bacterium]|nr:phosphoglycerate kinase [Candidatus Omnitrophota bacterium]